MLNSDLSDFDQELAFKVGDTRMVKAFYMNHNPDDVSMTLSDLIKYMYEKDFRVWDLQFYKISGNELIKRI